MGDDKSSGAEEGGKERSLWIPHVFPGLLQGAGRLSDATWRRLLPKLGAGWRQSKPWLPVGVPGLGLVKWSKGSYSCFQST